MGAERKPDACFFKYTRVCRGQFPGFHLGKADVPGFKGIFHIIGFDEIQGDDEACTSCFNGGDALVFIAVGFDDELPAKLFAYFICTKDVLPAIGLKDLRDALLLIKCFKRNVVFFFLFAIPLGVIIRLAKQGNCPHQGGWIIILGCPLVERIIGGRLCIEDVAVLFFITQAYRNRCSAGYPIAADDVYTAEPGFPQLFRLFAIG
ncbi:hypothetical protein D3C87_1163350 [compost metagenome]